MYERINGKLYKQIEEDELKQQIEKARPQIEGYLEGIRTCDKNIKAFNDQKERYENEINNLIDTVDFDNELLNVVISEKGGELGF